MLGPEQLLRHLLRYEHASALRDWLEHTHRPGAARAYPASLRGVLKEARRLQWMSTDGYLRALDLRPAVRAAIVEQPQKTRRAER